jgi:hypothetical protein
MTQQVTLCENILEFACENLEIVEAITCAYITIALFVSRWPTEPFLLIPTVCFHQSCTLCSHHFTYRNGMEGDEITYSV